MTFFLQLKLILWKNLLTRKRQKTRCVIELVWPLFLFLILMWVRTRGLRTNVRECYFTEKAMPSMGPLPFLQSFICTFNNTCHYDVKSSEVQSGTINIPTFLKLLSDLEKLFYNDSISQESIDIGKIMIYSQGLFDILSPLNTTEVNDKIKVEDIIKDPKELYNSVVQNGIPLSRKTYDSFLQTEVDLSRIKREEAFRFIRNPESLICSQNKGTSFSIGNRTLEEFCGMSPEDKSKFQKLLFNQFNTTIFLEEIKLYLKDNIGNFLSWTKWREQEQLKRVERSVSEIDQDLGSTNNSTGEISLFFDDENSDMSKFQEAAILIQNFFCGNQSTNLLNQVLKNGGSQTNRFDSLQDQFKDKTRVKYIYDNDTTPQCNKYIHFIEKKAPLRAIWRMMKPFVRGKILYTPVTPVTQRLMKRVNDTFSSIHLPIILANEKTDDLVNIMKNLNFLKEFLDSTFGKQMLSNPFIPNILNMTAIDKFIEESEEMSKIFNSSVKDLLTNISQILQCIEFQKVEGYDDRKIAEKKGMELVAENKLWALVEFENPGENELSPLTTYKIRMNTERVDNTEAIKDMLSRPGARIRPMIDLKYITYGFAYLQDMIDHSIITEQTGRNDIPGISLQQFPYPCYIDDQFIMAISRTFPLFMVLSWVFTCSMIVKSIVYEKEQRLKETMRVMGLGNGIHWIGWFIDSLIPMLFTILLLTFILVFGKVLMRADASVVYVFLLAYCLATIAQSFLISVFFSRANLSAACAGIIFFILYLPYPFMVRWMLYMNSTDKVLLSLSSNVAFGLGAAYLSLYEEQGSGLKWDNIWISPLYDDNFNLLYVILMLLCDTVIYLILTWYIEAVFPGQYGIPKKWYFLFTISYWTGKQSSKIYVTPIPNSDPENGSKIEQEPVGLKCGVAISHLSKVYDNGKVAVNDISLNFYEDQVTSFLGHNGAGKTTTISILMGLFPPSQGTAEIYGLDIRTDMDLIRRSLGMCPQHNVLFNRLTVEEHLWFYGSLRGGGERTKKFIKNEIEQMLEDLGIPHKRNSMATHLSGGMQRKLSIAVAFIGGSKTVILDEPTSGVDPYSRRSIWELLIKYRTGRTVILTTHYMDEADLLSDRIAIIANGKVQCCGSSTFLKSQFGSGYYLTLEMASYTENRNSHQVDNENPDIKDPYVAGLNKHIKKFVPRAKLVEHIGCEVTFVLPQREDFSAFTKLCDSLDENKSKLQVMSYGISDTSLEEIFLTVAEQNDPAMRAVTSYSAKKSFWTKIKSYFKFDNDRKLSKEEPFQSANNTSVPNSVYEETKEHRPSKNWRQFMALHTKRFHHTRRNKKAIFSELVLPALFLCMSMAVSSIFPKLQERPPLDVDPWVYPQPRYMFYSNDAPQENWTEKCLDSIKGPEGIGSLCVLVDGKRSEECVDVNSGTKTSHKAGNLTIIECSCSTGAQVCPAEIGNPPPPSSRIASGDMLYDMTGQNISKWITNTWPRYKEQRYGGYSLGTETKVPNLTVIPLLKALESTNITTATDIIPLLGSIREFMKPTNNTNNIKVWYNNKGWVSSVAYMSAINNVVLRASLPPNKKADIYGIKTINHPMNFTEKQLDIELIKQSGVSVLHAISVIFALSFVTASFTMYLIEERISNSKHLQLVSGVNRLVYWFQAFTWDMICYMLSSILCIFIFLIFNEQAYVSPTNFPGLLMLLILYGWSCIPLMYPLSFLFSVPSSAFVGLACANMFVGIITTVTTFVLGSFDDEELKAVDDIIKEVFLIFPHFCLGDGLMKLATNHLATASLQSLDIEFTNNIFEWAFLGKNLLCMFVLGIIFFLFGLGIEFDLFTKLIYKKKKSPIKPIFDENEEEDVLAERMRVAEGLTNQDILVINNLTKVYKSGRMSSPSVNHISVGVRRGECFGLLGLNGAGKTSTFKMLTGGISVTSGDATVQGHSIRTDLGSVRALLGYCPQFDALDPLLTPREHLVLYGKIRNIPPLELQKRVDDSLRRFGLGHYSDRLAGTLSGGNKRKLSTAIALIGNPPLVFLDEPTSGMDPKARRFLWTCIQDVVRQGCCVILTSHSMEECQALCTRLTIMVNGQFKCIGTSQHLKNKFGGGYSITIRCREDKINTVEDFMINALKEVKLLEAHYNQMRYQIPSNCKLSKVFKTLENARIQDLLIDYSLSQTTLEEVFIRFANAQVEPKRKKKMKLYPAFLRSCLICSAGTHRKVS